ncbi:Na+/H+ antiporter NhaC [Kordiimonas marina]|uniref:Na+/H+ antiporter NhaC n=1 Tax=Kordiimonas marina TaxID=2872312 RepID=UPI001FF1AA19|nr:Na+/H+ antiporter NhaC [Kordiimonas marina]MCJ9430076.1 Na+/H+ antiporter NhaC [Kordiimonas marina]
MTADYEPRGMKLAGALSVVIFLLVAISVQVFVFDNTGSTQITLIIVTAFASIVAMLYGYRWHDVQEAILYGCNIAMLPMMILMMVGVLIASWTAAGTIPALIYYGIKLLNPDYFLFSACLICSIGSLSTGSSWTTAATFGVGFMGIGLGLGIPPEYTAGAVISGSIFGDKMSPLSDSTNLASAVAQAELFDHVKSMLYSTVPAILLALLIYLIMGLSAGHAAVVNDTKVQAILGGISGKFSLNPIVLLPPFLVVYLIMKRMSGLAVMIIASLAGMAIAVGIQGYSLNDMLTYMNFGFKSQMGVPEVDKILSGGGLQNMMWTVSLGFIALSMGGVMEKTHMLEVILKKIRPLVHTTGGLVLTHVLSSFAVNLLSASQFMALIIPARMLVPVYRAQKLLPQICSRVSEDSATATSPLVPWGLGGVYYTSVLGVATLDYLPFTFFGLIVPCITLIYAFSNTFMFREGDIETKRTYSSAAAE